MLAFPELWDQLYLASIINQLVEIAFLASPSLWIFNMSFHLEMKSGKTIEFLTIVYNIKKLGIEKINHKNHKKYKWL